MYIAEGGREEEGNRKEGRKGGREGGKEGEGEEEKGVVVLSLIILPLSSQR